MKTYYRYIRGFWRLKVRIPRLKNRRTCPGCNSNQAHDCPLCNGLGLSVREEREQVWARFTKLLFMKSLRVK